MALCLIVCLVVPGTAIAQNAAVDLTLPTSLVGGSSGCPTPANVWQHLVPLLPTQALTDRLRGPGGPAPPVQVIDLGPSFRVIVGDRVREYPEAARDCAKRAQFAAVFVAVAAGADTTSSRMPPASPVQTEVIRAAPADVPAPPQRARLRLELGATAGTTLGEGAPTIAPGLAFRIAVGNRRLIPVAAVTVLAPVEANVGGVGIRQWQATADVDVRSASVALGRCRAYAELGAAFALLNDRPTNLAVARTQVSYAIGPRAAAGLLLATRGRLSPFLLISGAWFPYAPELFALPAGNLGQAAPWNVGATAGASWGVL